MGKKGKTAFREPLSCARRNRVDEFAQPRHLPIARLVRLTVLAVHGAETGMFQLFDRKQACAVRGAIINDMGPELERTNLHRMLKHVGDDNPMPDWPTAVQRLRTALPGLPAHSEEDWLKAARNTYREVHGQIRPDWDIAIARLIPGMVEESVDLWALFRALARVPILAVRGEKSEILSARALERMADALPGLIPVTVPEVGHAPDLAAQNVQGKVDGYLAQF